MNIKAITTKFCLMLFAAGISLASTHSVASLDLAQNPLFLSHPVRPLVMLNMSNDHQLYFKLYDDYSDITKDGSPDTTYIHDYDYYGYFDSTKCYVYSTDGDRYQPSNDVDESGYCNLGETADEWSGNFLNWATMTRMDAVRKILYGGYRAVDTPGETVLERSFLPADAHSFAKYYGGDDVNRLTPFGSNSAAEDARDRGVTLCNVTDPGDNSLSQNVTSPPLLRTVKGNYSLWASNERWQCRWRDDISQSDRGKNGNDPTLTGIQAYADSPKKEKGLGEKEYSVRVVVCDSNWTNEANNENCESYGTSLKPTGLLQEFGEDNSILFGLMTGSFGKNKSGGVLRKNIGSVTDEIDADNGTFIVPVGDALDDFEGIINTLNRLRIYGYRYENGTYFGATGSDACEWGEHTFSDGTCSNWGNPQSEIYLESLRYLAGLPKTSDFDVDDSSRIAGLNTAVWAAPVSSANYCAPLSVVQFNASTSSYDGDQLSGASDILQGSDSLANQTDAIGVAEGIEGNEFFVGKVLGSDEVGSDNELCTAKNVSGLSNVQGTCPDAPRLGGSYQIAGLAHYARSKGIPLTGVTEASRQTVRTYGVALAPAVPRVSVPVPGSESQTVVIQPACRSQRTDVPTNCAIVDFKIVEQSESVVDGALTHSGKLYVNWEDSEQGGDFDQDMWGIIDYEITSLNAKVKTNVIADSTPHELGFGYVISGTTSDGFHVHSGINGFSSSPVTVAGANILGCASDDENDDLNGCHVGDGATESTHLIGTSTGSPLEQPLYYAAKWGGYHDDDTEISEIAANPPETYYYATDPRELEQSLRDAFFNVAEAAGSASAVATNSTRLGTDTVIYQALFNSKHWTGEIKAIPLTAEGGIGEELAWSTGLDKFRDPDDRNIVTYDGTTGVRFLWDSISAAQQEALGSIDTLRWLRGEDVPGLREREETLLGDIVNSNPIYAGSQNYHFHNLPATLGGRTADADPYGEYLRDVKHGRTEVLYIGANGGMMHAFNAESGDELFAYVPSMIYDQLENLTKSNYGNSSNPHRYNVDGPIFVGDAYFTHNSVTKWRNILVGTLGAGGKGIFVLDVTDPDNFNENNVLFELTEDDYPEIGHITGQPLVAPTDKGWKIFFGNGYNSNDGKASLVMVNLNEPKGSNTKVMSTDDESGNGMAAPALLPDGRGVITHAYAGDLLGRMWKFSFTHNQVAHWGSSFGTDPFFTARDTSGEVDRVQPITAAPTLGRNAKKDNAVMVYFGTGSYLTNEDNQPGDTVQSFYALADTGTRITTTDRSDLMEKTIDYEGFVDNEGSQVDEGDRRVRQIGKNDDDSWWAGEGSKRGWYLDFWDGESTLTGERVISKPLLIFDRLLFPTLITSDHPCALGGSGWLMELIAVGDRYPTHSILGADGLALDYAVLSLSDVIRGGENAYIPTSNIRGDIDIEKGELPGGALGRMSWRQLR
ncbi:pilus assembly protein [Marinimicrobium sp. ABcell2]|uniref:pilus assembly protein n=1 Tax=Marinimicrobium sp. ABcell2 TaxID=3069751 RepID=UPI0027B4BFD1|nr:PilC/PilY family type IV pilus protein [Marinimicrobium sp. ABcell2]MDQ2078121.1 PilC/PilY family type IV pilus protein [Marinimicrobium sp. ABcell2]